MGRNGSGKAVLISWKRARSKSVPLIIDNATMDVQMEAVDVS